MADPESGCTDGERRANLRAGRRQKPRVRPYLAARGDCGGGVPLCERFIGNEDLSPERVPRTDGVYVRQLTLIIVKYHAQEPRTARCENCAARGLIQRRLRDRLRRAQSNVGGENFRCLQM